ncbi:unnamed protein product [Thelazia callipaeda]|uniref:TPR_REGION domain-containing protein n=1 Tax=Thelazia callipaeda TaxID=103827 RepID=A0A0N5CQ00_THECL|nr:unnamed protein product [Thelazia callipaeda]
MLREKPFAVLEAAKQAFLNSNPEEALELYNKAIDLIYPENHILYSNRSAIFLRLKRFDESLRDAEKSLAIDPNWPKGYLRKGDALRGIREFDEAIFAYCQGLAIENENEIIMALKDILRFISFKDDLLFLLNKMESELKFDAFLVISMIGQEYLTSGAVSQAIKFLHLALRIEKTENTQLDLKLSVVAALSSAYYQQRDFSKAIEYLQMQLEISTKLGKLDTQFAIHGSIVDAALSNNQSSLAVTHLERQIEIQRGKKSDRLQLNLTDLYIQLGKYKLAAQIIASLDTFTFQSIIRIVKLALAKEDNEAAVFYCNKLLEVSNSTDEKALATAFKCKCLIHNGKIVTALNIIRCSMATNLRCNKPSVQIVGQYYGLLSECYLATGQYCLAWKWAKKELKVATKIKSLKLEADALWNLSNIYASINDFANSIILCKKYCSMIFVEGIDVRLKGFRRLAELYRKSGASDQAEIALLDELKLAERVASPAVLIDAHIDLYYFYDSIHEKVKAEKHWEEAKKIFEEEAVEEREGQIIEISGDRYFHNDLFEEAIEAYNQCLMLFQEDNNLSKEAKLCSKLGTSHWRLYHADEALAYYHQSLTVYQQISDLESMIKLYSEMANIHFKKGNMEICHSCLRCYLTLADLLSKSDSCLDALISIGRTLLHRERYREAKKIFIKALSLTSERCHRRQRGLIFGYIAESYLGMGQHSKASLNFCKQIAFFDDIDDMEGKCEMLRHLIEEKQLIKDAEWAMQLCRNRLDLSQTGSIDLQVQVLKESAEVAVNLENSREACKFLEKAVILSITNRYGNISELLLQLKKYYRRCNARKRAVKIFRECLNVVGINSEERMTLLLELAKLELEEGLIQDTLNHINNLKEESLDKSTKVICEHLFACAYYATKNYKDALYHMQNFENFYRNLTSVKIDKDKVALELALIEWHCHASDYAIEKMQDITKKTDLPIIYQILDESCLYDLLTYEKLSKIAAVHWMMTRGDFSTAKHLFHSHDSNYCNYIDYSMDKALFLWKESKFKVLPVASVAKFSFQYRIQIRSLI